MRRLALVVMFCAIGVSGGVSARAAESGRQSAGVRGAERGRSVADDDLVRRLRGEGGTSDPMRQAMLLMSEVTVKLAVELDCGERTLAMQSEIVRQLDAAIEMARRNAIRRPAPSDPSAGERRRRRAMSRTERPASSAARERAGEQPAERAGPGRSRAGEGQRSDEGAGVMGRMWGNLPPRDRDALLQGFEEPSLPQFRSLIDAYYRALSELGEKP